MKWQVHGYLIHLHYRVTTVHLMVSLGREKAYICLGEVIGDVWQEYVLTVSFNELMKSGSDSCDPIYFGHVFNCNTTLFMIYEVTPEQCQPIWISRVPNQDSHRDRISSEILARNTRKMNGM